MSLQHKSEYLNNYMQTGSARHSLVANLHCWPFYWYRGATINKVLTYKAGQKRTPFKINWQKLDTSGLTDYGSVGHGFGEGGGGRGRG